MKQLWRCPWCEARRIISAIAHPSVHRVIIEFSIENVVKGTLACKVPWKHIKGRKKCWFVTVSRLGKDYKKVKNFANVIWVWYLIRKISTIICLSPSFSISSFILGRVFAGKLEMRESKIFMLEVGVKWEMKLIVLATPQLDHLYRARIKGCSQVW